MNTLSTIRRRLFNRTDAADLAKLPASYRNAGGGLMSRIATAGLLRLALRWPAASMMILILSVLAARVMAGRRQPANEPLRTP